MCENLVEISPEKVLRLFSNFEWSRARQELLKMSKIFAEKFYSPEARYICFDLGREEGPSSGHRVVVKVLNQDDEVLTPDPTTPYLTKMLSAFPAHDRGTPLKVLIDGAEMEFQHVSLSQFSMLDLKETPEDTLLPKLYISQKDSEKLGI